MLITLFFIIFAFAVFIIFRAFVQQQNPYNPSSRRGREQDAFPPQTYGGHPTNYMNVFTPDSTTDTTHMSNASADNGWAASDTNISFSYDSSSSSYENSSVSDYSSSSDYGSSDFSGGGDFGGGGAGGDFGSSDSGSSSSSSSE
jgi:uncharacterized membrane protein YgcG